ncbi:hypothetical protein OIU79_007712 [Salix purpurea]|uniref:Uncharacterized protein n=1 Tax=Salix purpurea TaxID=77065 RepID=A0A9Q0YVE1_SALPP|nr:hypothetical protein OIU79_007712 [Salix purpurea]
MEYFSLSPDSVLHTITFSLLPGENNPIPPALRPLSLTNGIHWPVSVGCGLLFRPMDNLKVHCCSLVSVASMFIACCPVRELRSLKIGHRNCQSMGGISRREKFSEKVLLHF